MANLNIKSEASQAIKSLERLEKLVQSISTSNERLGLISRTIASHYQAATGEAQRLQRVQAQIASEAISTSSSIKGIASSIQGATGSIQGLVAQFAALARNAEKVAQATRAAEQAAASARSGGTAFTAPSASALANIQASRSRLAQATARADAAQFTRLNDASVLRDQDRAALRERIAANKEAARDLGGRLKEAGLSLGGSVLSGLKSVGGAIGSTLFSALSSAGSAVVSEIESDLKKAFIVAAGLLANSVRLAIKEQPIAEGFGSLVDSRGLGNQVEALDALRKSARGTVSDLQLMGNANAALLLGAAETVEQLQFLTEAGRRLGKVMGRDATEGFNDLSIGIGRQSRLILDNLGLIVRVEDAQKAYADSVGTTVEKLGENEKRLAFNTAAYEAIRSKIEELGPEQTLAVDSIGKLSAEFSNLSVGIGKTFLPVVSELTSAWADYLATVSPENVRAAIDEGVSIATRGAGTILDFVLGKGSEVRKSFGELGSSLFEALTRPSDGAFAVLGVRFDAFIEIASSRFRELWELFKSYAEDVLEVYLPAKIGALFGPIGALVGVGVGLVNEGLTGFNRADSRDSRSASEARFREATNQRADALVADLVEEMKANSAALAESTAAVKASSGAGSSASTSASGGLAAAAAAEQQAREDAQSALEEEKALKVAELAWAKLAFESQQEEAQGRARATQKILDSLNEEVRTREKTLASLEDGSANLREAIKGLPDPTKQVGAYLDDLARELRSFPDAFEKIARRIEDIDVDIVAAQDALSASLDAAAIRFKDDIERRSKAFLLEEPQDGETVAVRAAKRRAQRDRRRFNQQTINEAFQAPSIASLGGLGGFGAQGIERAGSSLNQTFPLLQNALLKLIDQEGRTLLQDFEAQQTAIIADAGQTMEELNNARAAAVAEQNALNEQLKERLEFAVEIEKEAAAIASGLAGELATVKKDQAATKATLDNLQRLVRGRL